MTESGRAGRADNEGIGMFGPLERSGTVRAVVLVGAAVVVGALLMPSATRPSLGVAATSSKVSVSTTAPAPATTTVPSTVVPQIPVSSIKVLVANGTNTSGAAGTVSSLLSGKGFGTLSPVDALTTVSQSQVYAIGGDTAAAEEVASALGLGASSIEPTSTPVPVSSTGGATVVVVVGPDLASHA